MSSGSGLKLRSGIHCGRVSHGVYSQQDNAFATGRMEKVPGLLFKKVCVALFCT